MWRHKNQKQNKQKQQSIRHVVAELDQFVISVLDLVNGIPPFGFHFSDACKSGKKMLL